MAFGKVYCILMHYLNNFSNIIVDWKNWLVPKDYEFIKMFHQIVDEIEEKGQLNFGLVVRPNGHAK